MRKSLLAFLFIGGIALGFGLFNSLVDLSTVNPQSVKSANPVTTQAIEVASSLPEAVAEPAAFSIPALNLNNVEVESVGLNSRGAMDVPKEDMNVAWYNLGAKPGERGNAVIAGHLDTKTGAPAVFYDIKKLKPGDELKVKAKDGKEYTYSVTDIQTYELEEFPLVDVFGAGDKARLNLITCEGTFDSTSRLYSHRLVVYSELKS